MGIDYDGGMIVGELGSKIEPPEGYDLHDYAEDKEMDTMSTYYDAGSEAQYFGFCVPDVVVFKMQEEWLDDVRRKAKKFKELNGSDARLIGTQNIW